MPSLKLLDSLIAIVGVILVLSLIVQSLQSGLKKLLKIKSRQIEDSLLDLFENALGLAGKTPPGMIGSSPLLRLVTRKKTTFQASADARTLFDAVAEKFRAIGRVAQSGGWMLDSLAKDDLLRVLARVAPDTLLPDFRAKLDEAGRQVFLLESTLAAVQGDLLSGQASARLAALRQALDPFINDVKGIYKGDPRQLDPSLLVGDAMRLREIKLADVLAILVEVQTEIDRDLETARQANDPAAVAVLEKSSAALKTVAAQITDLHSKLDLALAPLRSRLSSVESWFDTIMQSFEERYTRGMKTWALVLSFLVVVALNANFFRIAHQIFTASPETLAVQVETAHGLLPEKGAVVQDTRKEVGKDVATYNALGFGPPIWNQTSHEVFDKGFFATLAGWLVMTLLLSVGAPFWEDTLESLFGVKNLLRKNTGRQNVEQESGAGNPKAS